MSKSDSFSFKKFFKKSHSLLNALLIIVLLGLIVYPFVYKWPGFYQNSENTYRLVFPVSHQTIGGDELYLEFDRYYIGNPSDLDIWVNGKLAHTGQEDQLIASAAISSVYSLDGRFRIVFNSNEIKDGDQIKVSARRHNRDQAADHGKEGRYLKANETWTYREKTVPAISYTDKLSSSSLYQPRYQVSFASEIDDIDLKDEFDVYTGVSKPSCKDCSEPEYLCPGPEKKVKSTVEVTSDYRATFEVDRNLPRTKTPTCVYIIPRHNAYDLRWRNPVERVTFKPAAANLAAGTVFDPEEDFYSYVEIQFDTPMYSDTDASEDSDEFMQHRIEEKKRLIKAISVNPKAEIDLEKTYFSPQQAKVALKLSPESNYVVSLQPIKDTYGESTQKQELNLEVGKQEYLGLRFKSSESVYTTNELPDFKFVQYGHPSADIMLCNVTMDQYAIIENMYKNRADNEQAAHDFFVSGVGSGFSDDNGCFTKNLSFDENQYVTEFDINDLIGNRNGLFYLTFGNQEDRQLEDKKPQYPLFFSVVNAHLSMKISENGKAFFWANDLETGNGISGLALRAYKADFTDYETNWNSETDEYEYSYFNPLDGVVGDGISLGTTNSEGFLEIDMPEDLNAYYSALASRSWYENGASALVVMGQSGQYLTYVSDQWNDGIADWNFGYYPADYYWYGEDQGVVGRDYYAHTFTDRKLYLPGETVYLKSVIRQLNKSLEIPQGQQFDLKVFDSTGKSILEESYRPNAYGSVFDEIEIPEDAALGTYNVRLSLADETDVIDFTDFNVEEFKKPTFKVDVHLNSSDVKDGTVIDPKVNTRSTGWGYNYYEYEKEIRINAQVNADYYSGGSVRKGDYEYKVYRQYYYEPYYWNDCFWGCYWEPEKDFITSGSGSLSEAGDAQVTIPVNYQAEWSDYQYIVEFTIKDESGESITGSNTILAKRPEGSAADPNLEVKLEVTEQFAKKGTTVNVQISPDKKWNDEAHNNQYHVKLSRRVYTTNHQKNTEGRLVPQVDFETVEVWEKDLNSHEFTLTNENKLVTPVDLNETGEWMVELYRNDESSYSIATHNIYVYGDDISNTPVVDDNKIKVLSEKTVYKLGDTARFLVRLPFDNARLLITTEKTHVVDHQLIDVSGNTLLYEVWVDDTFVPNGYLSFIAFQKGGKDYKVGYSEIVVDQSEKRLVVESSFDKEVYEPRERVKINLKATDQTGAGVPSELAVAVVDESLIALLGNIDMDILKKFYRKLAFQTDTALTSVGMLNQLYFSRKGLIGGSGDKGGDASVFTRSVFKNTAYYNGAVITNASGNATVEFALPDNIGDFRLIVLGSTKNNLFGGHENTFSVRQNLVIEDAFPLIFRQQDSMRLGANVFNHTDEPMEVDVTLETDELTVSNATQTVTVKAQDRLFVKWDASVKNQPYKEVSYAITATSKNGESDRIEKSVPLAETPLIASTYSEKDTFIDQTEFNIDYDRAANKALSYVELSVSSSLLSGIDKIVTSLLQYPHGCLEQTISTTLPNAILLKFSNLLTLDVDRSEIQENLNAGIDRAFGMQQEDGGFGYWPGDRTTSHHYSPYAIWGLATMKEMGATIDSAKLKKAEDYLIGRFKNEKNIASADLAEYTAALSALAKLKSNYFATARDILLTQQKQFGFHEKLFYTLALAEYDANTYSAEIKRWLPTIQLSKTDAYPYWSDDTYRAILAQLLVIADPESERLQELITDLYDLNLASYYYSTQTKAQSFIAFAKFIEQEKSVSITDPIAVTYRINGKVGSLYLNEGQVFQKRKIPFSEFGNLTDRRFEFNLQTNEGNQRKVYLDADVVAYPEDLKNVVAENNGATIRRQIYAVNGDKEDKINNNIVKLGEQYKMKLSFKFDKRQRDVSIEDHLPGGIQVLNENFNTVSSDADQESWRRWFNHIEYKRNMVFVTYDWIEQGNEYEFNYYFTPIVEGEFTLPPVSVFPMYQPTVEGHTGYDQLTVIR